MSGANPKQPDDSVLKTSKWDPNDPVDGEAAPPKPSRPIAVTEAFENLDLASSLMDEVEEPSSGGDVNQTMPYTPPNTSATPPVPGVNPADHRATMPIKEREDDRSIEEYMAGLLQRAGGGYAAGPGGPPGPEAAAAPSKTIAVPASAAQPGTSEVPGQTQSLAAEVSASEDDPSYMQKPAPERRCDLSDMREVANINARTALDTHYGRQLIKAMYSKLILTVVCTMISLWLVTLASSISVTYLAAVGATVASLSFGSKFLALARQLKKVRPSIISALEYDVPMDEGADPAP